MTTAITFYNSSNGKITRVVKCPEDMADIQTPRSGEGRVVGADGNTLTQYVSNGRVLARPENPAIFNGSTISNVPPSSVVEVDDRSEVVVVNGTAALNPTPGLRVVTVTPPWPMMESRFEFLA